MYDAIVIGARCAGSPMAMLLARRGYRVLLLDRAGFPSDVISTHLLQLSGVARLQRWGLLDRLVASGCPPIRRRTLDFRSFALTGCPPPAGEMVDAYCPRRTVLDALLVDAAVAEGVELRQHVSVQELIIEDGRVCGACARSRDGTTTIERASMVIGADGRNSFVARSVRAPMLHHQPALACYYYGYWSGVPVDGVEFFPRAHRAIGAFPTHDGQTCIWVGWPAAEFGQVRADVERHYLDVLDLAPGLAERVRSGRREGRFVGTADLPGFFRTASGPGWALVGDAAYHKDPITGQGIADAFHGADLLANAIDTGLSGREPLDQALAGYGHRLEEAMLPMYEYTCRAAAMESLSPERLAKLAALQGNQRAIDRLHGINAGTVALEPQQSRVTTDDASRRAA